jgi:tetratricopeptide (TPR) repeat protein
MVYSGGMRRFWVVWGVLVMALTMGSARADEPRVSEAQHRFEAGMANFHLEAYDKAIEEWEAGYRIKPAPQFLYNIAQAYRLSKRPDKALSFYQKYLKLDPDATNRAEIERHIAALTKIVESQKQAAEQPSTQPMPLQKSESPPPSVNSAATATPTATATGADLTVTAPARHKPVYKKAWFWGVVAGGAVVVAGAVTLGVLLSRGSSEQTLPPGRF